jgi:hypothetical protein
MSRPESIPAERRAVMDTSVLESARAAVIAVRTALAQGEVLVGGADDVTSSLAIFLLGRHADPLDLQHDLAAVEGWLIDQLAERLVAGVDWDRLNWT